MTHSTEPMPKRRTVLKIMHWTMVPLAIWFTLVQPDDVLAFGSGAFRFHSVLGLVFVTLALVWTGFYLKNGLLSRRAPKLSPAGNKVHRAMHLTLVWGIFAVAFTGFLLGLTSSTLLFAGDIVPIAPPLGLPDANALIGKIHAAEFYILAAIMAFHASFHIWRHVRLRDNALRIMVPKLLHRFL